MWLRCVCGILIAAQVCNAQDQEWEQWNDKYGDVEPATVWPLPKSIQWNKDGTTTRKFCPTSLWINGTFAAGVEATAEASTLLVGAIERYAKLFFYFNETTNFEMTEGGGGGFSRQLITNDTMCINAFTADETASPLDMVEIIVETTDTNLQMETNDSYSLEVPTEGNAQITAQTVFGAMRGLETLSQLIQSSKFVVPGACEPYTGSWDSPSFEKPAPPSNGCTALEYYIPQVAWSVTDEARYQWRGLMLDLSRSFLRKVIHKQKINSYFEKHPPFTDMI